MNSELSSSDTYFYTIAQCCACLGNVYIYLPVSRLIGTYIYTPILHTRNSDTRMMHLDSELNYKVV